MKDDKHTQTATACGNAMEAMTTMVAHWTAIGLNPGFAAGPCGGTNHPTETYASVTVDGGEVLLIFVPIEETGLVRLVPLHLGHRAWASTSFRLLWSFDSDINGGFVVDETRM